MNNAKNFKGLMVVLRLIWTDEMTKRTKSSNFFLTTSDREFAIKWAKEIIDDYEGISYTPVQYELFIGSDFETPEI